MNLELSDPGYEEVVIDYKIKQMAERIVAIKLTTNE